MPVKLFVSDVDGTLVRTDKSLAPSTIDAVKRCQTAGVMVALVSARPPRGMKPIAAELGLTTPLAGFNGGTLLGPDGAIVSQMLVPEAVVRRAIELFDDNGVDTWLFTADEWLLKNPDGAYVPLERRTVRFDERRVDDFEPYMALAGKIVGTTDDLDRLARLETELQGLLGDSASVHRSQKYYLDVTHPEAHKGNAVRALATALKVDLADVAVIGDMANDVPMFSVGGLSIAMGNATPEVQAAAKQVTNGNDDDGWAAAVDRFILPASEAT